MPYISPEVVEKVHEMDLLTYLKNYEPQELVHFGDTAGLCADYDRAERKSDIAIMVYTFNSGVSQSLCKPPN